VGMESVNTTKRLTLNDLNSLKEFSHLVELVEITGKILKIVN
jgi:hypothetical protein